MKIKIIGLLNMIAKGEQPPKEFIFKNEKQDDSFEFFLYEELGKIGNYEELKFFLNEEVEIIEDKPKEIKKINKDGTFIDGSINHQSIINMQNKLNEIIDKVNEMSKND